MEDIKNKLGDDKYYFLKNLQDYIGTELIFFGSIKRCDFMKENSDIDIAIISDNIDSTLKKLQFFLNLSDNKIRKIIQKIPNKSTIIYGYKTNYKNTKGDIRLSLEIIIYDEKYRKDIIVNINKINNFPIYILIPLIILKFLYYKLNIISKDLFKFLKKKLMNTYLHQELDENLIALKLKY
jgi:predicted nucleotidyltransferase